MMDSLRAGLEYLLSPVFGAFAPWAVIFALTMIKIVAIIAPLMICLSVAYLCWSQYCRAFRFVATACRCVEVIIKRSCLTGARRAVFIFDCAGYL